MKHVQPSMNDPFAKPGAPPKLKSVEDGQVPRWQIAMLQHKLGQDANLSDSPAARAEFLRLAKQEYQKYQRRNEGDGKGVFASKITGMEWMRRNRPSFTKHEYREVLPSKAPDIMAIRIFTSSAVFLAMFCVTIVFITGLALVPPIVKTGYNPVVTALQTRAAAPNRRPFFVWDFIIDYYGHPDLPDNPLASPVNTR